MQKRTSALSPESEQQFAALAALYWLRRVSQHEGCGVQLSMTTFNAGPIVLSRLIKYLLSTDSALSSEDSFQDRDKINNNTTYVDGRSTSEPTVPRPSTSSRLKLWISYVAAIAERASRARGNDFQSGFLSKARSLGHQSWSEVRDRALKSFLCDASVDPDTKAWFDRSMRNKIEH
jgi:hypothetical protein